MLTETDYFLLQPVPLASLMLVATSSFSNIFVWLSERQNTYWFSSSTKRNSVSLSLTSQLLHCNTLVAGSLQNCCCAYYPCCVWKSSQYIASKGTITVANSEVVNFDERCNGPSRMLRKLVNLRRLRKYVSIWSSSPKHSLIWQCWIFYLPLAMRPWILVEERMRNYFMVEQGVFQFPELFNDKMIPLIKYSVHITCIASLWWNPM